MFRVTATQPFIVSIRAHTTSCLLSLALPAFTTTGAMQVRSVSDIEEYTLYQPL